jgi:hypothetical protein
MMRQDIELRIRSRCRGIRIAVWGTSFSAAHAFVVAAIDRRVKAVCGQAPFISGG